ncbi:helix-turn-helix domain-containing protein [Mangrovivirga sp. M17]|uniref:Helix-turn-helix domain-containing protein n=1 Tax=Mangrovivirga halotolerans TaxID=2993936 RepID=A0ABT3RV98_9BACT|nr:helix-turn-helix domain-containing protein [Mangrovivirga halotolerans]MCX2745691.1 helix-turn-helix domain-containing protein [Mangrovivirga halotolerans]
MSLISQNLKYLRKKNDLTQEQFADKLGIKRSQVGAYEEGRADPRIPTLMRISEVFDYSLDELVGELLEKIDNSGRKPSGSKNPEMKVLAITVDEHDRENIELVPDKASAGYLNGYSDPEYIEELPKFQLPNLPGNATYRAFEISGDSMLPLQSGTIVIGQYLERPEDIKNGKTYVLVTGKEGIVYKRVFNYLEEKDSLYLVSDNTNYAPYSVPVDEVFEIWEAKAFISVSFPEPESGGDMTLDKLANMVLELQQEVIKLKDR